MPTPPPRPRRTLESGALILCMLAAAGCPAGPLPPIPVVFVHGFGGENTHSFAPMIAWLARNGWEGVALREFNMSSSDNCIHISAAELEAEVERVVQETGSPQVDLVGHLLGGLVVRHYVKFMQGQTRVRNVVTLTTPHHGTMLAPWYGPECSVSQMAINSLYLRTLNLPDETPVPAVRYMNVRSLADDFVQPGESALLAGAADRSVWIDHFQMLAYLESFELVKEGLQGAGLNEEAPAP